MNARLITILFCSLFSLQSHAFTEQDEIRLTAGMDCYEANQLSCARKNFEEALTHESEDLNAGQERSIKRVLYGIYYTLAQEKISQGEWSGLEDICNAGIILGVELQQTKTLAFKSFHVWLTMALVRQTGGVGSQEIVDKLQQVQQNLSLFADQGEVFSYLQNPMLAEERL